MGTVCRLCRRMVVSTMPQRRRPRRLARVRPVAVIETRLCNEGGRTTWWCSGGGEGGGRHACAAELYMVRPRYLHAVHCPYKRQGVAGPRVRTTARPVVVHPRWQV